jgi:dipeptidyl aminopeptidase/acylaminoacyl peptidase
MEDFFKNPEKAYYQISPNAKYLSFTQPFERRMNVFVQEIGSAEAKRVTSVTDRDIWWYYWKGNDRLLYLRDFGGDENFHVFAVDRNGENEKDLTPFDGVKVNVIDEMKDHETDILIGMNKRNPRVFDAYRLNTSTGELKLVAENPGNVTAWVTDHDYKIRVATVTDGVNTTILYRKSEEQPFSELITTSFKETFQPVFFTFDNKNVYAVSNLERDKMAVITYDPDQNKELDLIFEHPEVDVSNIDYSRKRKVLTEIGYTTWKYQREFKDQETQAIYNTFEQKFPGYEIFLTFNDLEETTFIARIMSDRTLGSYHLYSKGTGEITKLADRNPWLKEDQLAEMKPISYSTRDGFTINGYLTYPKGRPAKNLPVVVNPHGGPWARDTWGFRSEVQFLANRGYAVFQMNFRGSTGYGKEFWKSSFKEWGKKMQDDITDGVQWLIKEGIADPKRIAIYGGSYGGYATLAGVTFTPDLYCCGVDYVGVSNIFTWMNAIPPYWEPYREMLYEMVGNPETDSLMLANASPYFHADQIQVPMLVAQGANDPRVKKEESDQIVDALKSRDIAVEYIVKDNEGHGFSNEENKFDFYRAMESFLAKHL